MTREELTEMIAAARIARGLSWTELAEAVGRPVIWTVSALQGQQPVPADVAQVLVEKLGLPEESVALMGTVPMRGALPTAVPTDPTIYRFYEALHVYGPAVKEMIHELFGDGIMSAINFSVDVERGSHPSGDRVKVTFDGKFLPYDWVASEG